MTQDEIDQYLNISYVQSEQVRSATGEEVSMKYYPAKRCEIEDFDNHEEFFETWSGYITFCPSGQDLLMLQGQQSSINSKYISFRVERCQSSSEGDRTCKSNEEIDEFLKDAWVEGWVIE